MQKINLLFSTLSLAMLMLVSRVHQAASVPAGGWDINQPVASSLPTDVLAGLRAGWQQGRDKLAGPFRRAGSGVPVAQYEMVRCIQQALAPGSGFR